MTRLPTMAAVVLLATFVTACTDDADPPPSGDAGPAGEGTTCPPDLDEPFAAWAEAGFSGTISVTTAGEADCLAAYGTAVAATGAPNTVDTVFAIGSVSKAFTAAAVLALVDEGKLTLDDRAGDLVTGLRGAAADVTVEQLLLHTSGLSGDHGADHRPLDRDAAVAAIGDLPSAFAPGTGYLYSNAGYTLLALIVEEVSGSDYRDVLASRVLTLPDGAVVGGFWDGAPAAAGPRAVGVRDDGRTGQEGDFGGPHWAMAGNGDLAMTTRELATWTHALFTGQIVSPEAAAAIARPGFEHGDGTAETPGWVALDASTFGEPVLAAAGGGGDTGHEAVVAWLPESDRVVAVASNTPDVTAEGLLAVVGPALVAGAVPPPPEGPAPGRTADSSDDVDQGRMAELAGTYDVPAGGSFVVAAHEDGLALSATSPAAVAALFPLSDDTASDAAAHEDGVRSLLAEETDAGRDEVAAVEADVGPIEDVALMGTIVEHGELRTYVRIMADGESITGWYALDEHGGVAAADLGGDAPTLVVAPAEGGTFRPVDPTGRAPAVTVGFGDDRMTVTGPAGSTTASLAG